MVHISMSEEDARMLGELLEDKYLVDLRREISHTDSQRFRDGLYKLEAMLTRLREQLMQRPPHVG